MDHTRYIHALFAVALVALAGCVTGSDPDPITGDIAADAASETSTADTTAPDGQADADATVTADMGPDADGTSDADATECCQVGDECIPLDAQCPDGDPTDCSESFCSSIAGNLSCVALPLAGGEACGNAACGGTCGADGCNIPDTGPPGCANVNLIFTSSAPAPLASTIAGLDAHCADAAAAAGLPGTTWVAWASSAGNLVKDRIGPDVSGWVRVSTNHEPVAQSLDDLASGHLYYPPLTDENGEPVADFLVATGTLAGGEEIGDNCASWTLDTDQVMVRVGHVGAGTGRWMDHTVVNCDQLLRVVCVQADFEGTITLPPPPDSARFAFVAEEPWSSGGGIAGAHAACQATADSKVDAPAGTYKAFLATSSTAPNDELSGGTPFVRADGLVVYDPNSPDVRHAPMALRANGTHTDTWVFIGTADATQQGTETCDDWTSTTANAVKTRSGFGHGDWLGVTKPPEACSAPAGLWCFQVSDTPPTTGECTTPAQCDDGLGCTIDDCVAGACVNDPQVGSCVIDEDCYTDGQPNSTDTCQVCDPSNDAAAWSAAPEFTLCDDGDPGTSDDQCVAGVCTGTSANCGGGCDDGLSCTVDVCDNGSCSFVLAAGCAIAGTCYADGEPNANNSCEVCNPAVSTSEFTPVDDEGCFNVAFVTTGTWTAGQIMSAGSATNLCNTQAGALGGTFVALIAQPGENNADLPSVQSAPGWVRPDGLPVAANLTDLLEGRVWYSPSLDPDAEPVTGRIWTGLQNTGSATGDNCGFWGNNNGFGTSGVVGAGGPDLVSEGPLGCDQPAHILCLQVDAASQVGPPPPPPPGARRAFLSTPVSVGASVDDLDDACNQQAGPFLTGQFKAFVATTDNPAHKRVDLTKGNFYDPVGVQITADAVDLSVGSATLHAPLIRGPDGTVHNDIVAWPFAASGATSLTASGNSSSTCANWSSTAGSGTVARVGRTNNGWFYNNGATSCSEPRRIMCLQSEAPPNVIFVASEAAGDTLGGADDADVVCSNLASQVGLPGTFLAVMSGVGGDLQARLSPIQGGFVRTDGRPVAANWQDLLDGTHWYPPNLDEVGAGPFYGSVWTGSNSSGVTADHCAGWIDSGAVGATGELGAVGADWISGDTSSCSNSHHILCVQTDGGGPAPLPSDANGERYMFVSTPTFDPSVSIVGEDGGIAGAHAFCQAEADAAGSILPPGLEWRALLPMDDQPPIEDVDLFVATPYTDPTGVIVVNEIAALNGSSTPALYAPLWRRADGTTATPGSAVIASDNAISLNTQENCSEWTDDTEFMYEATLGSSVDWYAGTLQFGACSENNKQIYCYSKP